MENSKYAVKIQALWRGYRSRKGDVLPCCCCGYDMTLPAPKYPETMSAVFFSVSPCAWCQEMEKKNNEEPCECLECRLGHLGPPSEEEEDEERFIPCCICGRNASGSDFECWKVCSRSCLTAPDRERW